MGREIKRVPLDFDWPIGRIWLPYMVSLCDEQVDYILRGAEKDRCEVCRHAARLADVTITSCGCPDWNIHPPTGDGWQLWETVTEGSPISPVFATPEELADWLVSADNDTSITKGTTREQWLAMIQVGWSPSLVHDGDGIRPGVQA